MLKSISRFARFSQLVVLATTGASLSACGSSQSTSTTTAAAIAPQPVAGDIERTTFAASLRINLDSMVKRASGLYVQELKPGTGQFAGRGKSIVVRYAGWLPDGKEFDSGEITVTLGTNKTIPAWEEGLLGMRVGGRRRLVTPPNLAYGSRGAPPDIPPNAVLVFEMELVSAF